MNKYYYISIIIVLVLLNTYTFLNLYQLKKQSAIITVNQHLFSNDIVNTYKINLNTSIQNNNIKLESVTLKDSLGEISSLKDDIKMDQNQILICRFSEYNCESCVNFAIQQFNNLAGSLGKNDVLYLGNYRNNRIFNQLKTSYSIHNQRAYNVSSLDIPIEKLGYPYYLVLSKDLTILSVFVPDKATPEITNSYLRKIKERYFMNNNNPN